MSSTRYIEIDSTWRNRNLFPNPSNFEIPISESGSKTMENALSPVCCSSPIISWKLGNFNLNRQTNLADRKYIEIIVTEYLGDTVYNIEHGLNQILQPIDDYYKCSVITNSKDSATQTVYGRIKNYIYLGDGKATLTLNTTLSGITAGDLLYILDATYYSIDATGKFNLLDPYIYVPTGFPGTNAYNSFVIDNISKKQYRQTTKYDGVTKLLGVDISKSPISTNSEGPIDNWTDDDILILREVQPEKGFVAGPKVSDFTSDQIFPTGTLPPPGSFINELSKNVFQTDTVGLQVPQIGNFLHKEPYYTNLQSAFLRFIDTNTLILILSSSEEPYAIPDYLVGNELIFYDAIAPYEYINKQIRTISQSYYDSSFAPTSVVIKLETPITNTATSTLPTLGSPAAISASMQFMSEYGRITKYVNLESPVGPNSNVNFIEFPFGTSIQNNYYNELYINIVVGGITYSRIISSYLVELNNFGAPILQGATLNRPLPVVPVPGSIFWISSGIISPPFKTFIASTDNTAPNYDPQKQINLSVLPFSYDGFNPFVYTGSRISQQEMTCYTIELKNLILPNQVLDGGFGSLIPFYPYIYVELQNVSAAGSGLNNVLYSNNPNATKMMFRVPITDVPNPVNSTYIKLDSRGVVQTLKFKPNDNLKFGVYLCDGTPFETLIKDTKSPLIPNPLIQISAIFAIKRID